MKKYFIHVNGSSAGPYSLEDLRAMRIQKTTPLWYDGLGNWRNAGDVAEIKALFVSNATTFQTSQNYSKPDSRSTYNFTDDNLSGNIGAKKTGNITAVIVIAVVLAIGGIGFAVYKIQENERERMDAIMNGLKNYEEQVKSEAYGDQDGTVKEIVPAPEPEIDYGTSTYSGRFNNYSGGILKVVGSDEKNLSISLKYDNGYGCSGEISGEGSVISENKLQLRTTSGCKISIKYSTGFVMIEESTSCSGDHGTGCSFDGIYSKEK